MSRQSSPDRPRRSLRQALRDLLHRLHLRSANNGIHDNIGSGILKRAQISIPHLPNFSTVSGFPTFDDLANIAGHDLNASSLTPLASTRDHESRLLPKRSLSHFDFTSLPPTSVCNGPKQIMYGSVPDPYGYGASRQASLVSVSSQSTFDLGSVASRPTLRIRDSSASMNHSQQPQSRFTADGRPWQQSKLIPRGRSQLQSHRAPQKKVHSVRSSRANTRTRNGEELSTLQMVDHFQSFCVLDSAQYGSPVTGTSSDLQYIFEVGEQFVLDNQQCDGNFMDVSAGVDAEGNDIVHLLLFTPLVVPDSGRSRYLLVSLIDVTDFLRDSADQVPELDTISEEDSFIDELSTPPSAVRQNPQGSRLTYQLSADDFLGGCSLPCDRDDFGSRAKEDEDIWLTLAAAEGSSKFNNSAIHRTKQSLRIPPSTNDTTSHASSATDDILEDFMAQLQELYSDFFLLGQSPLADNAYEICNVSPRVYESKEYINGHLSCTPAEDIESLSEQLGQVEPFTMQVRWGTHGKEKHMYCSPLFAGSSITWICYLVDEQTPPLW